MKYRNISTIIFIIIIVVSAFNNLYASAAVNPENNTVRYNENKTRFRDGELIIKFKKKPTDIEQRSVSDRLNKKHGSVKKREFKKLRMQHVKLKPGMTVEQAIAAYKGDPDVEYAQPNYRYRMNAVPNDPDYAALWNMAKIKAPQAWDLSTGSASLVVGTIDTGIDYNHPDLLANLWINSAEQSGVASADDDGNGYADDIYGWNTLTDSGDPMDDQAHGTHVAGTIGAAGNNGIGVAGINWNVKVMACKAFDNTGNGLASDIIECLQYFSVMKDRGVNLVATNNSYSGDPYDQAMIDAINLMPDVLFIAAASNDSNDNDIYPYYPASYKLPNVIAVAATDMNDRLADFSNYGRYSVHVAAPGVNIQSTVTQYPDILPENAYSTMSGTSMAAPHVAGLAALLKAHDPSRDWKAIRNLILTGAEPVAAVADITVTGGRINAFNSLACSNRTVTAILDYPRTITAGVPVSISVLNIRCGVPAGPVSVNIEGAGVFALADDGAGADLAAGDGIYTATWTPADDTTRVVTVTAAGFSRTFEVPTLTIVSTAAAPPAQTVTATSFQSPTGVPYVQTHSIIGGKPPLTWTATTSLPPGLSINPSSGTVSGTSVSPGNYIIAVRVVDSLGYSATFSSTLTLAAGIKSGWPIQLAPRTGVDIFSQFSFPPVLADLDGNGSDEIIVAVRMTDSDNSALYLLDSTGVLTSRSDFLNSLSTPAVADLNGDGTPEIIVAEQSRAAGSNPALKIHVLDSLTLTDVGWFTPGSHSNNNFQFKSVTVEDLDGDGTPEIIAMGRAYALPFEDPEYDRNVLFVLNADGSIVNGWPKAFDRDTNNDRGIVAGDLYGNGTRQIVMIDNGGMARIYSKDGTELQAWGYNPRAQGTSEFPVNPLLADLDGDGVLEVVIAYAELESGGTQRVAAFRPDGTLLPGWPRSFPGKVAQSFSAADLLNEGKTVIIIPFTSTERGSELLVLRADGSYAPGWPVSLGNAVFNNYHEPLVADLNGDGINEVLVNVQRPACADPQEECYTYSAFVEAVGADGLPVTGYPKPLPGNAGLWSTPAIGDIDGDGLADVIAKSEDGKIHAWSESAPYLSRSFPWPQYRHDIRHSGTASAPAAALYPTIAPVTSPTAIATQTISGTRPDSVAVTVTLNGQPVAANYPAATTWQANLTALAEGTNRIRVAAGGYAVIGAIVVDSLAPVVDIIKPANGFVSSYYQHVMLWRVTDNSETSSRALLDGVELTVTSGDYMPNLANGKHILRVEATDASGRTASAESSFTIDASVPSISVQSPENGKSYQAVPQLLYTLSKASIPTVEVTLDGIAITQRSGEYLPPLTSGSHLLQITAIDDVGQSGSTSVTFTIASAAASAPPVTTATPPGKTYPSAVDVTLGCTTADGGGCSTTYYTTDGSIPTTASNIYTEPLTISSNSILKFFSRNNAGENETIKAQTYLIVPPGGGVTFTWPATGGTTNRLYRATPGRTWEPLTDLPAAQTGYTDSTATLPNTIYRFAISTDSGPLSTVYENHTAMYNGWNTVAVPYNATGFSPGSFYGGIAGSSYEWIPTGSTDPDNNGHYITAGSIEPGKGYFVRAGVGTLMSYAGTYNTLPVSVTLWPGWTLIANPTPSALGNIGVNWLISGIGTLGDAVTASRIGGALYWWNGNTYDSWNILDMVNPPVIEPWKAYWILNMDNVNHTLTIQ